MNIIQHLHQLFQPGIPLANVSKLGGFLWMLKNIILSIGALVLFIGVIFGLIRFILFYFHSRKSKPPGYDINYIRRDLGNTIVLGLEFIIAADIIETTTIPDYYSLGILAVIVAIRTFLSYTLSKEIGTIHLNH